MIHFGKNSYEGSGNLYLQPNSLKLMEIKVSTCYFHHPNASKLQKLHTKISKCRLSIKFYAKQQKLHSTSKLQLSLFLRFPLQILVKAIYLVFNNNLSKQIVSAILPTCATLQFCLQQGPWLISSVEGWQPCNEIDEIHSI